MNKFFKSLWVRLAALGLGIVMITGFAGTTSEEQYFEIAKNIDIFGKLYREVYLSYVDEVEPGKFMREGIDAMLESLDPFTQFISASEIEDFKLFCNTISKTLVGRQLYRLQLLSAYHLSFSQNSCNFSVPGAGKTSIVYAAFAFLNSFINRHFLLFLNYLKSTRF